MQTRRKRIAATRVEVMRTSHDRIVTTRRRVEVMPASHKRIATARRRVEVMRTSHDRIVTTRRRVERRRDPAIVAALRVPSRRRSNAIARRTLGVRATPIA
jgi:hypothetical protein